MQNQVFIEKGAALVRAPKGATLDEAMAMITNTLSPRRPNLLNAAVTNVLLEKSREVFSDPRLLPSPREPSLNAFDWMIPLDAPGKFCTEGDIVEYFMKRLRKEVPVNKRRTTTVYMEQVDVVVDSWREEKPCEARTCVAFVVFWGIDNSRNKRPKIDAQPKIINILKKKN